jgi:hypothetical protein
MVAFLLGLTANIFSLPKIKSPQPKDLQPQACEPVAAVVSIALRQQF